MLRSAFASMLLATTASLLVATSAIAQEKPLTRAETEALIKQVIQDNPDLIMKSLEAYQMQQQAESMAKAVKTIAAKKEELTKRPGSPVMGNAKGDVTLVEFFDYHCGYCKHFYPVLQKLMEDDKKVRIVMKEFPILSQDSELAAKAALAVNRLKPAKYADYHAALMKMNSQFTKENLAEKAAELGVDKEKLLKEMDSPEVFAELKANRELADAIGISGTPAMVIGNELIPGMADIKVLEDKLKKARENKQ